MDQATLRSYAGRAELLRNAFAGELGERRSDGEAADA